MNNILLIGGTGFVGKYLARSLREAGESVSVINRSVISERAVVEGVAYFRSDLGQHDTSMEEVFGGAHTVVILTQPNHMVIQNIIAYLAKAQNLKKLIYVSSVLLYPSSLTAQGETSELAPGSPYENGKFEEEGLVTAFCQDAEVPLCIARLSNVYGDVKNRRLIGFVFDAALENKTLKINGDGGQKRDYIFIDDAVRFLKFLILAPQENAKEIINVSTGSGSTIMDIISIIDEHTGHALAFVHGPPVVEKNVIIASNKKILKISGINVEYDLNRGLKETYQRHLKASY